MLLRGLHLLLTYQCLYECDHCFVWSGPRQSGTFTIDQLRGVLRQAGELGTVRWVYFEGGEPFLYYPTLVWGVGEAARLGFQVGVVSNAYWATSAADAEEWLRPLAGKVQDLTFSDDAYHDGSTGSPQPRLARQAAAKLGIPTGAISVAPPTGVCGQESVGQLPAGRSQVMYRGRAVAKLAEQAAHRAWEEFTACPHEDLREPGRLHLDPLGNLQLCQGLLVGNLYERPLAAMCRDYDPPSHPIAGPLLEGGPAALVRRYALSHAATYADACHLCDEARRALRERFPALLGPDQVYGAAPGTGTSAR